MAVKVYRLKDLQITKSGWTHLFIAQAADMTAFNTDLTLTALVAGDVVQGAFIDIRTLITGPTAAPTLQIKAGTVAITPTVACKTANYAVTDNTIVGATTATGAANLTLSSAVGGGDGAAATAGEVWVYAKISRLADRKIQA
jgi:hypothetical protein